MMEEGSMPDSVTCCIQVGQGNPTTEKNHESMEVQSSIYFPPRNSSQIVQCGDVAIASASTHTNKRKLSSRKSRRYYEEQKTNTHVSVRHVNTGNHFREHNASH